MSFDRFIPNPILGALLRRSMAIVGLLAILANSFTAHAGGTRIWELAGFAELDKGELKQMLAQKGLDIADVNIQFKEEQAQQRREDASKRQDQQGQQDEEEETY